MIVFSLPKNKLWNGTGFILKQSSIELSSLCFAEQSINIGSGKYKVKIIGSSLSGNGIFLAQIMLGDKEVGSKTVLLNSRSNTEISFDIELYSPGPYTIKLSRGKESIGRISIDLLTLFKVIEPKQLYAKDTVIIGPDKPEATFFVIDYDSISSPTELLSIFESVRERCFFLIKANEQLVKITGPSNYRLFFEWRDLFDYLNLVEGKKVTFSTTNMAYSTFIEYNCGFATGFPVKSGPQSTMTTKLAGIIF